MPRIRHAFSVAVLAAFAVLAVAPGESAGGVESDPLVSQIVDARKETWRWQRVMHQTRIVPAHTARELLAKSTPFKQRSLALWEARAVAKRARALNPPHERQFRCIHRHEGAWDANTGNGYYGGLQMNLAFQRSYGPRHLRTKGTANRWTPLEQIWVGERALRAGRGFHPWPVAARRCGLI